MVGLVLVSHSHEVAEGVFAAVALPGRGCVGNATIIDLGDATLVFDCFLSPRPAAELRRLAETIAPARYVVESHWHGDHTIGSGAFGDAIVISTAETRTAVAEKTVPYLKRLQGYARDRLEEDLAEEWERASTPQRREESARDAASTLLLYDVAAEARPRLADIVFTGVVES